MYGFHKKVGLSDNSMRASERKNKTPNEYYNPYFKRGKPNLLWLIQKPKPAQGKGKGGARVKQEEDFIDDDGEEPYEVESSTPNQQGTDNNTPGLRNTRQPLLIGQGTTTSPQTELSAVHHELEQIRQQQRIISGVIQKIKQDHQNLYGQAAAFQELHSRHENSINAILTFLATVYNRSLEGQTNIQNLFAGAIPADLQRQGSVVDVGDYSNTENNSSDSKLRRPLRRFPLLLNAPPARTPEEELNISASPSPTPSTMSAQQRTQTRSSVGQTPRNLVDQMDSGSLNPSSTQATYGQSNSNRSSESSGFSANHNASGSAPENDIMSFINSANANDANILSNSRMDFPQALSHLQTADGKSPLTTNERNNVLQLMANGSAKAASNGNTPNNNNALMSPNPPDLPVPNIEHWNTTQNELDFLEKTLKEQDSKVANLSTLLQPLSPSGTIPGLNDPAGYDGLGPIPSDPLDFDNLFNSSDYFGDAGTGQDLNFGTGAVDFNGGADFDFATPNSNDAISGLGLDGSDDHDDGRRFETVDNSVATSPANTVVDGGGGAGGGGEGQEEEGNPRRKRRRK
jgi:heat shock transcription factor